jgi:hypothetical protein
MSGLLSTITQLSLSNPFAGATINSFFVILVTEIGDKTFFIAAVLAMRHSRFVIYAGAMGALALMHVLSCFMGYALPALIPKQYTHTASAVSCFLFGSSVFAYSPADLFIIPTVFLFSLLPFIVVVPLFRLSFIERCL